MHVLLRQLYALMEQNMTAEGRVSTQFWALMAEFGHGLAVEGSLCRL